MQCAVAVVWPVSMSMLRVWRGFTLMRYESLQETIYHDEMEYNTST